MTTTMTDREQVESMTDRQLVAFWNVLQFDARFGHRDIYKETLVSVTLSERGIPHEVGKLTEVV
jgi:phosphopentomutase